MLHRTLSPLLAILFISACGSPEPQPDLGAAEADVSEQDGAGAPDATDSDSSDSGSEPDVTRFDDGSVDDAASSDPSDDTGEPAEPDAPVADTDDLGPSAPDAGADPPDAGPDVPLAAPGAPCAMSGGCAGGLACDDVTAVCVPAQCTFSAECEDGQHCTSDGDCAQAWCTSGGGQCGPIQTCFPKHWTLSGTCVELGPAGLGEPCSTSNPPTWCQPGLLCAWSAELAQQLCAQSCSFWDAPSICPEDSACLISGHCTIDPIDPATQGEPCGPAGSYCAPVDGRATGWCHEETGICQTICRFGQDDCLVGECTVSPIPPAKGIGLCCAPDCTGKACGDDGCGGSCGACDDGSLCSDDFVCEASSVACPEDDSCPSELVCAETTGLCVDPQCSFDAQCAEGQECQDEACKTTACTYEGGECGPVRTCSLLEYDPMVGVCKDSGLGVEGGPCGDDESSSDTGCEAGLYCWKDGPSNEEMCRQQCSILEDDPGCPTGQVCDPSSAMCLTHPKLLDTAVFGELCTDNNKMCASDGERILGICHASTSVCEPFCLTSPTSPGWTCPAGGFCFGVGAGGVGLGYCL